jgi:hypothetical protein
MIRIKNRVIFAQTLIILLSASSFAKQKQAQGEAVAPAAQTKPGAAFEPNWVSLTLTPTRNSFTQNLGGANLSGSLRSSGTSVLGLGVNSHYNFSSKVSGDGLFSHLRHRYTLNSNSHSGNEYRFRIRGLYEVKRSEKLKVEAGLNFNYASIPYFSLPTQRLTGATLEDFSLYAVAAAAKATMRFSEKAFGSVVGWGGIPAAVAGSQPDRISLKSGYVFGLSADFKRKFNNRWFFDLGAMFSYEYAKYSQSEPYAAENSVRLIQQSLRLGCGLEF